MGTWVSIVIVALYTGFSSDGTYTGVKEETRSRAFNSKMACQKYNTVRYRFPMTKGEPNLISYTLFPCVQVSSVIPAPK